MKKARETGRFNEIEWNKMKQINLLANNQKTTTTINHFPRFNFRQIDSYINKRNSAIISLKKKIKMQEILNLS